MPLRTTITIIHHENNQLELNLVGEVAPINVIKGCAKIIDELCSGKMQRTPKGLVAAAEVKSIDQRIKET